MDQCANLNNLSPAAHVSNSVSWGDYTALESPVCLFFFFFKLAKTAGCMVKIDHYTLIGGRDLSIPPLA